MRQTADDRPIRPLPRLLRPGLRAVFIGYNPGIESARAGHYYAFRGNVFWRQLSASGIVGREVSHEDDARLGDEAGIGFTDLCARPTVRAGELTAAEIAEGARELLAALHETQPRFAVFSGRGIYQLFGRQALGVSTRELAARSYGEQPERIDRTVPWVIPSSSGLASRWHGERLGWLQRLREALEGP